MKAYTDSISYWPSHCAFLRDWQSVDRAVLTPSRKQFPLYISYVPMAAFQLCKHSKMHESSIKAGLCCQAPVSPYIFWWYEKNSWLCRSGSPWDVSIRPMFDICRHTSGFCRCQCVQSAPLIGYIIHWEEVFLGLHMKLQDLHVNSDESCFYSWANSCAIAPAVSAATAASEMK